MGRVGVDTGRVAGVVATGALLTVRTGGAVIGAGERPPAGARVTRGGALPVGSVARGFATVVVGVGFARGTRGRGVADRRGGSAPASTVVPVVGAATDAAATFAVVAPDGCIVKVATMAKNADELKPAATMRPRRAG